MSPSQTWLARTLRSQVRLDGDFDVIACLLDVNPIEMGEKALSFEGLKEESVEFIPEVGGNSFGGGTNSKVINLSKENDTLSEDGSRVEAWLMSGASKLVFVDDRVDILIPEAGGFRMAL